MSPMNRLTAAALVAMAASVAACSDSTSPASVDTAALSNDLADMAVTFENNAAFQSMASLSFYFPSYGATAAFRATMPKAPASVTPLNPLRATQLLASRPQFSSTGAAALFPADVLGKTLVWSTDSSKYVVSGVAGAPANGIRIMLYTVDQFGEPNIPLAELGYLDLTDESTAAADKIGVLLKLGSTTIADYDITAVTGLDTETLTAVGYIQNTAGTTHIDFTLELYENSATGVSDFDYTLTANNGAQVVVNFHDNGNDTGTGLVRVSRGGNSVELSWSENLTGMTGQIEFNGVVVATITQTGTNDPVFTGANGHELTPQQQADVFEVFAGGLLLAFVTLFGIFGPAILVF